MRMQKGQEHRSQSENRRLDVTEWGRGDQVVREEKGKSLPSSVLLFYLLNPSSLPRPDKIQTGGRGEARFAGNTAQEGSSWS